MSTAVMAAVFMLNPQTETEQGLPAAIEALKTDYARLCAGNGGSPAFAAGFVNSANFNADGKPDFVIDSMGFVCQGFDLHFCGESGCRLTVFVSSQNGYDRAFDAKVQGYGVYRRDGLDILEVITAEDPCSTGDECGESAALKVDVKKTNRMAIIEGRY